MFKPFLHKNDTKANSDLQKMRAHRECEHEGQTFILEEILTLSGIFDTEDFQEVSELSETDADSLIQVLNEEASAPLEVINRSTLISATDFESGVFQVTGVGSIPDWR